MSNLRFWSKNGIKYVLAKINIKGVRVQVIEGDPYLHLAVRYFEAVEVVSGFDAISWLDIILHRVRLVNIPGREGLGLFAALKRKAIRFFNLTVNDLLARANIGDCLFGNHGSKVIFVTAHVHGLIYSCHSPGFRVLHVKDELRFDRFSDILNEVECLYAAGCVDKDEGLTVFTNIRQDRIVRAYRKLHPNRRIIVRYHDRLFDGLGDRVARQGIVDMLSALCAGGVVDEVESYYRADAEMMGGLYRPNGVDPKRMVVFNGSTRSALYHFIDGSKDGSRRKALDSVRAEIFRIYPCIKSWVREQTLPKIGAWMTYEQYLLESAGAEIVVDLVRLGQDEGFSYRIPEALFGNRKIITNRMILREEPFYSPERVFLIGVDPLSRLQSFLESDIEPLPESILRLYDASLWWTAEDPRRDDRQTNTAERRRDFLR